MHLDEITLTYITHAYYPCFNQGHLIVIRDVIYIVSKLIPEVARLYACAPVFLPVHCKKNEIPKYQLMGAWL